mmetsp:Transcript_30330/g.71507  ORF Transcript_30330/g.71507 Transcript_30330/m.71507 type:complete len:793 (-) Transcript_30330:319-2697(-)
MSFLNLDGGSGSAHIVERLNLERTRRIAKSVGFDAVDVDEAVLQAAVLLFRDRQQQQQQQQQQTYNQQQQLSPNHHHHHHAPFSIDSGRRQRPIKPPVLSPKAINHVKLERLCINNCPANPFLEYLIEASMGMDLFQEFELQGNMEEEEEQAAEFEAAATARREQRRANRRRHHHGEEVKGGGDGGASENDDDDDDDDDDDADADADVDDENDEDEHDGGPSKSSCFALDALGFRMRFSRRLRKVELINLPITRDHAESLMYGIETNDETGTGCRLDTLVMEGVRFVDGDEETDDDDGEEEENKDYPGDEHDVEDSKPTAATKTETSTATPGDGTVVVHEFCEGFPNNRTLETIKLERCKLTDAQLALIFDSLARHPTLKHLFVSENSCRHLGMEALDRMLVSPPDWMSEADADKNSSSRSNANSSSTNNHHCKLESLDLSYQFTSEETYGTGEHIQLDILTRNCTTLDTDARIYPNLRKLVLQGNQIDDSDMRDLAFLIRHRFPHLEELDLRFNEITTEGLELFANHSDPFYEGSSSGGHTANNNARSAQNRRVPPPSSRLRTIRLTNNPLVMTNQTSIVILRLLKIYPELQLIQSNLEWEDGTSIAEYIQHLLDINRAGRVLLLAGSNGSAGTSTTATATATATTNTTAGVSLRQHQKHPLEEQDEQRRRRQLQQQQRHPIPLGAWPLVLARLTRQSRYPHYIPVKNSLNGMYYLIRHGPIIVEQMATSISGSAGTATGNSATGATSNTVGNAKKADTEQPSRKRKWGDPALGGYETLADFLRCELGAKR